MRSFFVEAKKPSVDIRGAVSPAYQLRRYAWSAKLPVSILTDFEEFAVYDCRVRPVKTDKASTARIIFHEYTDYARCWDELAGLFSPDAIRRGALDKFVASKKVKKGTAEVDAAFLDEIENWRNELARNIALRNKDLSQRDLNFAVQRTIDRIVFLRICEDRGIERYGTLQSLPNAPDIYRRLFGPALTPTGIGGLPRRRRRRHRPISTCIHPRAATHQVPVAQPTFRKSPGALCQQSRETPLRPVSSAPTQRGPAPPSSPPSLPRWLAA